MSSKKTILTVVADRNGEVFEFPELLMAGGSGMSVRFPRPEELVPLPPGSRLFTIPGAPPVGFDRKSRQRRILARLPSELGGGPAQAVSAFLTPGYTRTLLPAADYARKKVQLPLWSYTAVGWCVEEERFYAAAVQVDRNIQWEPDHFDDRELDPLVRRFLQEHPNNRLVEQLSRCALDYHCFAAKNLFFRRWEAPLPISPACNSSCLGCISLQESDCCPASQERLTFVPSVEEICQIAIPHLEQAPNAIVSFGQGCEGDPILQAGIACEAVRKMRKRTGRGTINFNSNASLPDEVDRLAQAGIDSVRISLNSVREPLYNVYYRPRGYAFNDVVDAIGRAVKAGLFTMLNYLVFPGVTDQPEEIDALVKLVKETGVDLIQMRNLSIDPVQYWRAMGEPPEGVGMVKMMEIVKNEIPSLQYGYFNRTRETFYPEGYEREWPIC